MTAVQELQATIEHAVERLGPAVVGLGSGWRGGSGVVIAEGAVLTVAHNLRRDEPTITFADGRRAPASVAGVDPDRDLAVLAVDTGDAPSIESFGEAPPAAIGTAVLALANPGGRGLRATSGFVSASGRSFRGPSGRRVTSCVEHTAPLPRGSSGGPLVDAEGRLLGLNAIRLEGGLIVAVPAERSRIETLERGEHVQRLRLGVAVAPPHVARRLRRAVGLPEEEGVLVRSVERSSAAERAGLEQGDLIVAAAGRPIDGMDALYEALDAVERGGALELSILRGAEREALEVRFDASSEEEAQT